MEGVTILIGFDWFIHEYCICQDFGDIYTSLTQDLSTTVKDFTIFDDFIFGTPIYALLIHCMTIWFQRCMREGLHARHEWFVVGSGMAACTI